MKKILFASFMFLFFSCQKEISREPVCGIVVNKKHGFEIEVDYSGTIKTFNVGFFDFVKINIGDQYCK